VEAPDVPGLLVRPERVPVPVHLVEHPRQRLALDRRGGIDQRARLPFDDLPDRLGGELVEPGCRGLVPAVEPHHERKHVMTS
jgi:hypothetical protein